VKQIDFEGTTHQFPDDFTDADIAKALGGGAPAAPATPPPKSAFTQGYEKYFRDPAMNALRSAVGSILDTHVPPEMTGGRPTDSTSSRLAPFTEQVAGAVVPQTPIQAGALAGTLGSGALARGAGSLTGPLFRVLGGATGGEAGNYLAGGPQGRGALEGGGGAALGEGIGAAGGKVARSLPGAKGRIAADDAAAYAGEMGRQSPPLAGAQTVQDLQRFAQGEGRQRIGDAKEGIIRQIEAMTGNAPLSVPAAGPNNMTLREVNDILSEVGARMKNPLERTFQGRDQTQLYGQIRSQLDAALAATHPDAPGLFNTAQSDYAKGMSLLRPLQQQNAYRLSPGDTQFNTPAIQRSLQNPKNAAGMRNKLGDADYEALLNVMTRGAGQGQDVLASGRGGMLDALQQTIGRGTNSGAMGYLGVPLRTALPNIGSQYTGRRPFSLPPQIQELLDVALQRKAGQIGQP
jgi:hypothetical protein